MNAPLPALTLERTFAAPRELVFRAWVEPHRLAQWWGPYGFTVEACDIEPTPGGKLFIETRLPDGQLHRILGRFTQVEAPAVLAFDGGAETEEGEVMVDGHTRVSFDDDGGRTLAAASSIEKDVRGGLKYGGNKDAAQAIGRLVAERALAAGVKQVKFDRREYKYHGRVAALAEAAREAGLSF